MEKHYQIILKDTQERVYDSFSAQILQKGSSCYGAFTDEQGIIQAKYTIYRLSSMIAVYCCRDSSFYKDENVYNRIILALDYVRSVQHANGLFDYVTCNFNSAPDTAFCIKKLMPIFYYLREISRTDQEENLFVRIDRIIEAAAHGMMEGGFHTPNHRWAIASSLIECAVIYEDENMRRCAEQYLSEGIDCNSDGEYSEKSAGNYNRVNNDAMITLAEATGDSSYEEYVIRNLRMMLHYWEPDGSVFTANSTRFDKDLLMYPTDYYTEYMLMAERHQIPEFYEMANTIIEICEKKNMLAPDCLIDFLRNPGWRTQVCEGLYQNPDYAVFYRESGIARVKTGRYTFTVMNGKSDFLYFHDGSIKLQMKVAGSFCEHRAFHSETIEEIPGGYHLHQTMHGWYYLPWSQEKRPQTSNWWEMDNSLRDRKMGPDMQIDVYVTNADSKDGIDVRIITDGVQGDPWRIEMAFTGAERLENEHMAMFLNGSEAITVKEGMSQVTNGRDTIVIGPGFGTHHYMEGKEDSELKTMGASTLYFTDYTGFDHTIRIRNERSRY